MSSSTFKKLETMLMQCESLRDVKLVFESIPPEKVAGVLNGRTETGHTLLHCACRHSSAAVVLYLIQSRGFKCNVVAATGDFPLHIAVSRVVEQQQSFASIRVLQALLSCIQSEWITMFDAAGLNPLHLAVKLNCLSATKLILNSSPDSVLCCTETSGQNIVHLAAQRDQPSFMEFLLCAVAEAGFNASDCSMIQDKVGRTARVVAAGAHDNAGKGEPTARVCACPPRLTPLQAATSSAEENPAPNHRPTQIALIYSPHLLLHPGFFRNPTHDAFRALFLSSGRRSRLIAA